MKKYVSCLFLFVFSTVIALGQTPRKPLPRLINLPSKNQISPSLSGDGRTMIFMTDYSEGGDLELKLTTMIRNGVWAEPIEIYGINQSRKNNLVGAYFLSYDGKSIYYTSQKSYGIGKYDIWMIKKNAKGWSIPVNLGKPLNSEFNEGSPSLSPDGNTLFFMRCDEMDTKKASGCKIMFSTRKGNYWGQPKEMPEYINSGNSLNPKILPDNQTLIYSSNVGAGKGGLDFFMTRNINGTWSQPEPLDYLNTPRDELYVSIPVRGDLAYYSGMYRGFHTLIKAQIPKALQPQKVILLDGIVNNVDGDPLESFIQLYDLNTKKLVQNTRTTSEDGQFSMLLTGGKNYDFSITPIDQKYNFHSEIFVLDTLSESSWEKFETRLPSLQKGLKVVNQNICFEPGTAQLDPKSSFEIRRINKLLKTHGGLNIEIHVFTDEVIIDSIQSPDLTEVIIDTIQYEIDSVIFGNKEVVHVAEFESVLESDTVWVSFDEGEANLDTLKNTVSQNDTLEVVKVKRYDYKYFYHNDRTGLQAEAILESLEKLGVPAGRIRVSGKGDSHKIVENNSDFNRDLNRRVEIFFN